MSMKRVVILLGLAFTFSVVMAQNSYIVKTRGAKRSVVSGDMSNASQSGDQDSEDNEPDFVRDNFKFYSLCDWQDGMKFMVMPEKYDLIVNTFTDATTNKEVGSGSLRYKVMIYKGHNLAADGSSHINFFCPDNNKNYYYQIPNGTFEDYCYGKLGVPTLAYLGDVDIARTKLMGAKVYTLADVYYVDSSTSSDDVEEIAVPKNTEATVTAIGAGSRSFPVKIICELPNGKEFFQNVAISRTNSGLRDDEFIMENTKHTFNGAFQLADANVAASGPYAKYIGRNVYTKYATKMVNAQGQTTSVRRFSNFIIKNVQAQNNTNYVKMTLKSTRSGAKYTKSVTFVNDNVAGDIDGYKEDYYNYLFGAGTAGGKGVSKAHWAAIQKGRAVTGMTKSEVRMAKGDADKTFEGSNGRVDWVYDDGTIVKFAKTGRAFKVEHH